ncbi:hypothetical protein Lsed01_00843 [Demequina sediminis]|uniref:STAS domain-containing protein n=2 Tax=Demequina sediminis TaxID=1930058 RepID=A0ABP9WIF6_9MICO
MNLLAAYDLIAGLHCTTSQVRMRSTRELVSLAQSGFRRAEEEKALVEKGGVVIVDLSGVESLDYRDGEALRETLNLLVAASSRRQITLVLGVTAALSAMVQALGEGVYNAVLDASPAVVDGMSR